MTVDISGRWSGKYYYPPKYFVPSFPENVSLTDTPPVPFEARFEQTGNNIYGEITEENTFAPLGGTILVAEVSGYVAGGIVGFAKTYDSGENAMHTIDYHGYVSDQGQKISGHWQIENWSGTFVMHRELGSKKSTETEKIKQTVTA